MRRARRPHHIRKFGGRKRAAIKKNHLVDARAKQSGGGNLQNLYLKRAERRLEIALVVRLQKVAESKLGSVKSATRSSVDAAANFALFVLGRKKTLNWEICMIANASIRFALL